MGSGGDESQKRMRPRRKPFRPMTKQLDFVASRETTLGTLILARDPWQFYRILIPKETDGPES